MYNYIINCFIARLSLCVAKYYYVYSLNKLHLRFKRFKKNSKNHTPYKKNQTSKTLTCLYIVAT